MEDNEKVFSVTYEIVCIPDITLIKNRIGSTGGLGGLLELHNSFLRIWNKKCLMSNASLHLFYEYIPWKDWKLCRKKNINYYLNILPGKY